MRLLFAQGLATDFFSKLAEKFEKHGHDVFKIHYCGGDRLFWGNVGTSLYCNEPAENLNIYYSHILDRNNIDAIILFSDCRPVHKTLIAIAKENNIPVFVFEEGYLRPNWITMEENGTNANSTILDNIDLLREYYENFEHTGQKDNGRPVSSSFFKRAGQDIAYSIASTIGKPYFASYKTHRPYWVYAEYFGFLKRFIMRRYSLKKHSRQYKDVIRTNAPVFMLPLQLESDFQIREHSDFSSMEDIIDYTMRSFAKYAPQNAKLIVKIHPLDNGICSHEKTTKRLAAHYHISGRVEFLEHISMPPLLRKCRGVVVANSTVGISALMHTKPVKVLARAIYDKPGLTYQNGLDTFWNDCETFKPDPVLVNALRNMLIDQTQINGGFFSSSAVTMAVNNTFTAIMNKMATRQAQRTHIGRHDQEQDIHAPDAFIPDKSNRPKSNRPKSNRPESNRKVA